jgi:hypothetical protein
MLSSSAVGVGVSATAISGLTYFSKAIGSFRALIKALNYVREERPRISAAKIRE